MLSLTCVFNVVVSDFKLAVAPVLDRMMLSVTKSSVALSFLNTMQMSGGEKSMSSV